MRADGPNPHLRQTFLALFGIFCCLLVALSFKIYYAISTHQPTLADNYYEIGRNYDRYLEKNTTSENRRLSVEAAGPGRYAVRYTDAGGAGIAGARFQARVSRRATLNNDQQAGCETDASGQCQIAINFSHKGYWEARFLARDDAGQALAYETYFVRK